MAPDIHPSAIVDPGAELADGVVVGPGCVVEAHVRIGEGTVLDPHCMVRAYTRMGRENRVHPYACLGGEPQDLKFHGEKSDLVIGDRNTFREFVTVHRGTENGGGITAIGSGCLLMAYTHVAHDCHLGDGVIMSNAASLAGHVRIDDRAIIGGMSGVHQFVRIGEHAFVGGMSGVANDLPPYMLGVGNRATVHGPNLIGLRRAGLPKEAVNALRAAYRRIWRSETPRKEALDAVEQEYGQIPQVRTVVEFIRASERGVAGTPKDGQETPPL